VTLSENDGGTQSFISQTNAQLICYEILKFTLKYTINALTCFGLTKPSSGGLAVCASLKLQYWCQLKYFVIE
jgi:hypothetical protein